MSKMKEVLLEIQQMLIAGEWPASIVKRTGYSIELVLQAEKQLYETVEYDFVH